MADPPPYPGTPRWVKVFAMTVIALILLGIVLTITGIRDKHGRGRHMPAGADTTSLKAPEGAPPLEAGHTPPERGH